MDEETERLLWSRLRRGDRNYDHGALVDDTDAAAELLWTYMQEQKRINADLLRRLEALESK